MCLQPPRDPKDPIADVHAYTFNLVMAKNALTLKLQTGHSLAPQEEFEYRRLKVKLAMAKNELIDLAYEMAMRVWEEVRRSEVALA